VVREHYPDPTDTTGKFVVVDVKAVAPLPKPVTLSAARTEKRLKDMILVNNTRLSVQPVTAQEWKAICALGGMKG
jgi:predicted RNA-binding protein with PUA-like domain